MTAGNARPPDRQVGLSRTWLPSRRPRSRRPRTRTTMRLPRRSRMTEKARPVRRRARLPVAGGGCGGRRGLAGGPGLGLHRLLPRLGRIVRHVPAVALEDEGRRPQQAADRSAAPLAGRQRGLGDALPDLERPLALVALVLVRRHEPSEHLENPACQGTSGRGLPWRSGSSPACSSSAQKKEADVRRLQARALYEQALKNLGDKRVSLGLSALKQAIDLDPEKRPLPERPRRGATWTSGGRPRPRPSSRRPSQLDPSFAEAQHNLGLSYAEQGRLADAVDRLPAGPGDPDIHYPRGRVPQSGQCLPPDGPAPAGSRGLPGGAPARPEAGGFPVLPGGGSGARGPPGGGQGRVPCRPGHGAIVAVRASRRGSSQEPWRRGLRTAGAADGGRRLPGPPFFLDPAIPLRVSQGRCTRLYRGLSALRSPPEARGGIPRR